MDYNSITQVERILKEKNQKRIELIKEEEILKECFLESTKKDYARTYLQFIKDLCLWDCQEENIDKDILAYKKGRRDIWIIIRNFIPKDLLAEIEIYNKYRIKHEREE